MIDAIKDSSELKYDTVELLNSGASSPILLIMFTDIWGIVGCRNCWGFHTTLVFTLDAKYGTQPVPYFG